MVTINVKKISGLAYFSVGAIFGIILISVLLIPRLIKASEITLKNYGNALASMAAHQAVDASFNHDLVQLHVILQDVIENPNTLLAAIYDVENNLLVQAGSPDHNVIAEQTYTAPIVLHQSVAGYLSVSLKENDNSFNSITLFIILIIATLLAVCLWSLYYCQAIVRLPKADTKGGQSTGENHFNRASNPIEQDSPENDSTELPDSESTAQSKFAYARITISNFDLLEKQLNPATLRVTLQKCESIFKDILALYGGQALTSEGDGFTLTFNASDKEHHEAMFRACCSAYLIIELTKNMQRIPLILSAYVSVEAKRDNSPPARAGSVVLHCDEFEQTLLTNRLNTQFCEELEEFVCINDFKQPYQNLLSNQLEQLVKMH